MILLVHGDKPVIELKEAVGASKKKRAKDVQRVTPKISDDNSKAKPKKSSPHSAPAEPQKIEEGVDKTLRTEINVQ